MTQTADTYGQLETIDDRYHVRFTRRLAHPPEKVWRAITEDEHLEAWFPTTIEGERTDGAPLTFSFRGQELPPFQGTMVRCEPPRRLEFFWGPDLVRIELSPDGSDTVLTLIDVIDPDEQGKAARDAAGWHACLDALEHHIGGTTPPWDPDRRWSQVSPHYVEHFPSEASSIGRPPGFEE